MFSFDATGKPSVVALADIAPQTQVLALGDAGKMLRVNASENGLELRLPAEVLSDIGAASAGHAHAATYQPLDGDLTAIAALTHSAGRRLVSNGSAWAADDTPGSFRNRIINGAFDIWQRGTSFASIAASAYCADRWTYYKGTTGAVHDISRSTDVPGTSPTEALYSFLVDCATADAAVAAGDLVILSQKIEGQCIRDLVGNTFTLSFWVKATKTGTYCVAFRNSGTDRSYVAEYTVSVADTWEFKTVTVSGGCPTAGTWDYTTGVGLQVDFTLMAGSTFQTTASAWQTGNFTATASQVNACDNVANNFRIANVQLERGAVATPFERPSYTDEYERCRRYFRIIDGANGWAYNTTAWNGMWDYSGMRATPTLSVTGTLSISDGIAAPTAQSSSNVGVGHSDESAMRISAGNFSGLTQYRPYYIDSSSSAGKILASAEL